MSKGMIAMLGLAAVGAFALTRKAQSATIPDEQIEFPEDEEPANDVPPDPAGDVPPTGNGEPTNPPPIPEVIGAVNLSGNEETHYVTEGPHGRERIFFRQWVIANSLNGMDIEVFQQTDLLDNWIAFFWHPDGPGSNPAGHAIIYKISKTATTADQEWMIRNIAGLTP